VILILISALVVAGGVSANKALREELDAMGEKGEAQVFYPRHSKYALQW
jgi:tRNA A37 threonylcarbamoyltransferase TsaD